MKAQLAFTVFIIISIVASLSILIGREIDLSANRYTITATVTDKAVKNYDDNGRYLIYTKDSDGTILVMEIEDNIFVGQFNSSDIYAEIETVKTYTFDVGGSRVPIFSWYPDIYSAIEQNSDADTD